MISNVVAPGVNTIATNVLQCLEQGPRIVYTELDLDFKTSKPTIPTTTVRATERTISGMIT